MRKSTKMLKRFAALFLIVLMSINSFAAVVSDNDGPAFVTKAEFEELKKGFNEQISRYNSSLDSKIDGKIAEYLNGIHVAQIIELYSYLNNIGEKFVDSTTFDWPQTRTGTYRKWYINLGALWGKMGKGVSWSQIQFLTGAINAAAWKTENTDDYGIYWYGTKEDGKEVYKFQKYMYSRLYASVGGIYTAGNNTPTNPSSSVIIPSKTFTNGSTSAFEAASDTWSPSIGGTTLNIAVTKSFGISDTFYNPELLCVTGNLLSTDSCGFVQSKNLNKPGTTNADKQADQQGWEIRGLDSSGNGITAQAWTSSTASADTKVRVYNHDWSAVTRLVVLNEKASTVFGENIFYYEGLPIFTNDVGKGEVELKLKFTNSGSKQTVFKIQNKRFTNEALPTTGYKTTYKVDQESDLLIANHNAEITVTLENVKNEDTYWIKARPLGSNNMSYKTTIVTQKIRLVTE